MRSNLPVDGTVIRLGKQTNPQCLLSGFVQGSACTRLRMPSRSLSPQISRSVENFGEGKGKPWTHLPALRATSFAKSPRHLRTE